MLFIGILLENPDAFVGCVGGFTEVEFEIEDAGVSGGVHEPVLSDLVEVDDKISFWVILSSEHIQFVLFCDVDDFSILFYVFELFMFGEFLLNEATLFPVKLILIDAVSANRVDCRVVHFEPRGGPEI